MGVRVINTVEKNVVPMAVAPIVVPAQTATKILSSIVGDFEEYAGRYIQNVGSGIAYYNFTSGTPAGSGDVGISQGQYCGVLFGAGTVDANGIGSGQQLDISNFPGDVWVYSVTGTTIAVTILLRKDLIKGGNIL